MCGTRNQRFLLLYGTQKGQAQAIAEEIGQQAEGHGFQADLYSLQDMSSFNLESERDPVVIIISTTGTGDPPDPAVKFVRAIQNKELRGDYLCHLRYGLLGLGDSEYTYFCNGGKVVDRRLQELGAQRFYPTGYADDCVGLELTVDPWIEGLWGALKKEFMSRLDNLSDATKPPSETINLKEDAVTEKQNVSDKVVPVDQSIEGSARNLDPGIRTFAMKGPTSDAIKDLPIAKVDIKAMAIIEHVGDEELKGAASGATKENPVINRDTKPQAINQSLQSTRSLESAVGLLNLKDDCSNVNFENKKSTGDLGVKAFPLNSSSDGVSSLESSLVRSVPPLSQASLTVPSLPPPYLDVLIHDCDGKEVDPSSLYPGEKVFRVPISQSKCLTTKGSLKTALMLELDVAHTEIDFQPGNAFRVICHNPPEEVEDLLDKLGLAEKKSHQVSLSVRSDTKKRGASVPDFIPKECSLQFILTWCLEIRATPKKALLRALVEFTSDLAEKRRLQELCSKQGAADYNRFVRDPALCIIDLLTAFPSCRPSLGLLIEHLPKLQARPYSAANSGLFHPGKLHIVFNVVEFLPCPERPLPRRGVCTGWLADLVRNCVTTPQMNILGRPSTGFNLPSDTSIPILMVGPGTGIAPFIGFLQHREKLRQQNKEQVFGETWLFFGCRSHDKDYLFREDLRVFLETGNLTELKVCFSREAPSGTEEDRPKYVQDCLKMCSRDVVRLLIKENGCLYVCGDAKNMAKDVNEALLDIFCVELGVEKLEAMKIVASLRDRKQYRQDIWS